MLVAVALAGCGGSTSGGGSTESVAATEETSGTSESEPEISAACTAAMAAYSEALVSDPNISEGPFQRRTIHSCKSRDEWLKAVEPYTEGEEAIAFARPERVLWAFCGGEKSAGPACHDLQPSDESFQD